MTDWLGLGRFGIAWIGRWRTCARDSAILWMLLALLANAAQSAPEPSGSSERQRPAAIPAVKGNWQEGEVSIPYQLEWLDPSAAGFTRIRVRLQLAAALATWIDQWRDELPNDACLKHGWQNWVIRQSAVSVRASGQTLSLTVRGLGELWACGELAGIETRSRLGEVDANIQLPMQLQWTAQALSLVPGPLDIGINGRLANVAEAALRARGPRLTEALLRRARKDDREPGVWRLPQSMAAAELRVHSAEFQSERGAVDLIIVLEGRFGPAQWLMVLKKLTPWVP